MIFTNVSRMGDFLLTLPVVSWYYKTHGEKAHYVLSKNFPLYKKVESLVLHQSCVEKISYVDVGTDAFVHWKFNPGEFGIDGPYYNFGFPIYPDRYIPKFFGEINGLGYDEEFKLECPGIFDTYKDKTVWIQASKYRNDYELFKTHIKPEYVELDLKNDVILNVGLALGAKNTVTTMGGFAIIMELANKVSTIYGYADEFSRNHMYYKNKHNFIQYDERYSVSPLILS